MNMYLKKICIVLATIIFISTFPVSNTVIAETATVLNYHEEALLKDLGIIEENVDYAKDITRSELAYLAAKVCNISESTKGYEKSPFYDVSVDDKNYKYICALIDLGVFAGDGNGFFRPDDVATYNEVCKVFSVILGYKTKAQYTSYIDTARESGIVYNVDFDNPITWGTAAKIAFNTLHTGILEAKVFGEAIKYSVSENYLAIEFYHNLKAYEGIVSGIYGTTLTEPDTSLADDEIIIGRKIYVCAEGKNLFGKHTVFYIDSKDESIRPEIKFIYESEKNVVLSINAKDMEGKSGSIIKYYQGNKERKVNFLPSGDVIINGVAYPSYADNDFCPDSGCVTLIDNNDDRVYDVAIIDSYEYIVVGGIDYDNNIIYDKNNPANSYGSKDKDSVDLRLYKGETEAYMSALTTELPVAIKKSRNTAGRVQIKVYLPSENIESYVGGVYNDHIVIEGERYDLENNTFTDMAVSVGDIVSLYKFDGRVGAILHSNSDGYIYGYLVDVAKTDDVFNPHLQAQIITQSKNKMVYVCAKNLYVDGTVQRNIDTVISLLGTSAGRTYINATWPRAQVIRYKLNSANELSHIDTNTYDYSKETTESLRLDLNSSFIYYSATNSLYTNDSNYDLKVSLPVTTNVWTISTGDRADTDWHGNALGDKGVYPIEAYNVDAYNKVGKLVVAYTTKGSAVSAGAEPRIIQNVETVLNEEGDVARKITVVGANNTPKEYILDQEITLDVEIGDIVRFNGNARNNIALIEKSFSVDVLPAELQRVVRNDTSLSQPAFLASMRLAYGAAVSLKDGKITHTTSVSDDIGGIANYTNLNNFTLPNGVPCYIYDSSAREVRVGTTSVDNIITYEENRNTTDKVIIYTASGTVRFVYIIR